MFFGTPSASGKFYKGLSTDTPVNHDLHWKDRVVKENHMVTHMKKTSMGMTNPEMFIKRPWTDEETQQLRDAVRAHGPNNWEVICRDRTFLEMIGNHTMEDIKSKWRSMEKSRIVAREKHAIPQHSASVPVIRPPGAALNVANQLKLKQKLLDEQSKREELEEAVRRERAARLEAEKKVAIQVRERRRLQEQVGAPEGSFEGSQSLARAGHSLMAPSASQPQLYDGGGDVPQSQSPTGGHRHHHHHHHHHHHRPDGDDEIAASIRERLTSRSTAIQLSAATRERARALLDSVRQGGAE